MTGYLVHRILHIFLTLCIYIYAVTIYLVGVVVIQGSCFMFSSSSEFVMK